MSPTRKSWIAAMLFGVSAFVLFASVALGEQAQVPRVAVVLIGFTPEGPELEAFRQGLREVGYTEGRDILLEYRSAEGDYSRLPSVVAEAIQSRPAILIVETTPGVRAAKSATSTIPIVMPVVADPVGSGLVASLAHPGGNVTGLSMMMEEIGVKRLELLAEAVQGRRIGVLWDPSVPFHLKALEDAARWARSNGLQLTMVSAGKPDDLQPAFAQFVQKRVQAVCLLDSAFFSTQRGHVLKMAKDARLPVAFGYRPWAEAGALLSYTADFTDMFRRTAGYVDKILKGAKPSDLPIEQATKFQLIVNLKAAKAFGLTLPDSLLIRADEVMR